MPQATGPRVPQGALTVALSSLGTESMLPPDGNGSDMVIWDDLYDYLLYADPKSLKLGPGLATTWTASADARTYTFKLRDDVQFHNGDRFSSADVKFSMEQMIAPAAKNPAASFLRQWIDTIDTPDATTVIFHLKVPTIQFPPTVSNLLQAPIMPKAYIEKVGVQVAREHPVGTGPFKFVERKTGEYVRLEALDQHWRQVPYFKTVELRLVREATTRLALLQTGEADIIDIEPEQKPDVVSAGSTVKGIPNTFAMGLMFGGLYRQDRPQFDPKNPLLKKEVREALNYAIDRDALAKQVWRGEAVPLAAYPFLPGQPGYDSSLKPYPYDPAKARQLLAQAGYANGFDLKLWDVKLASMPGMANAAIAVSSFWNAVGVRSTIQTYDSAAALALLRDRKASGAVDNEFRAWKAQDPGYYLNVHFSSAGVLGGAEDPGLEAISAKVAAETDPAKYAELLKEANHYIYDQFLCVPMVIASLNFGVGKRVDPNWVAVEGKITFSNLEYVSPSGK